MIQWLFRVFVCLSVLMPLNFGPCAWAEAKIPPVPTTSIYTVDYAGLLSADTKSKINQLGGEIATKSKAQIVVLTVKSLDGQPIEDYALSVLRGWKIGDGKLNNGVLLLVSSGDRKSRVEVGYGLEGALTDSKTGAIQDRYMIPFFAKGDYNQGIYNGYLALARVVAKEYNLDFQIGETQPLKGAAIVEQQPPQDELPFWAKLLIAAGITGLLIIDWVFLNGNITYFVLSLLRSRGGGSGRGGGRGGFGGGSGGGGGSSRGW